MAESKAKVNTLAVILMIIAVVAVCLRFAARSKKKVGFGVDDYTILPSLVSLILLEEFTAVERGSIALLSVV